MRAKYEMWLSVNNNKNRLQLPVNPSSISISNGSQNSTVNVSGLGEVTILQDPVAKTFEFSSFFPNEYGPYCEYFSIPKPWDAIEFIEKYKNKIPFRFIITNTPINLLVSVDDFKYDEKGGDVGTIYYELKLKEYPIVKPRQIATSVSHAKKIYYKSARKVRPNPKLKPRTYTVVPGDYLIKIARKTGVSDWRKIAKLNGIRSPYLIYPRQVLKLP